MGMDSLERRLAAAVHDRLTEDPDGQYLMLDWMHEGSFRGIKVASIAVDPILTAVGKTVLLVTLPTAEYGRVDRIRRPLMAAADMVASGMPPEQAEVLLRLSFPVDDALFCFTTVDELRSYVEARR